MNKIEIKDLTIFDLKGNLKPLDSLTNRELIEVSLRACSNIPRYGGHITPTLSVIQHISLVYDIIMCETDNDKLGYHAILHEIEEGLGVGDIVHDVKSFLFQDNSRLKEYKQYLYNRLNLDEKLLISGIIKEADIAVGILESNALAREQACYKFNTSIDREKINYLINKYGSSISSGIKLMHYNNKKIGFALQYEGFIADENIRSTLAKYTPDESIKIR